MPELPEVETVVRTLESQIKDLKILDIEVLYPNIIVGPVDDFKKKLINQSFRKFKRRGKYLLFEMDDICFVSHLRMEGKYYIQRPQEEKDKHIHVIFKLSNGYELRYKDVRKFGRMELIEKGDYLNFKDLGPEPFDSCFDKKYVKDYLFKISKPIKEVLLDQSFVAGIGNIYADEILFEIGINPVLCANKLTINNCDDLVKATQKILSKAIEKGGTTIRSYTSSLGVTGLFQLELNVHTMNNCKKCNSQIKKIKVGGRGTYYCPLCQK